MYEKSKKYKNLALFDFDGTLYQKDSFTGFIFYAFDKGHIFHNGLKIIPWINAYYLKFYPAYKMRPKLFQAMFKDACFNELDLLAKQYAHELMYDYNPQLFQQLLAHQHAGDQVVLVSASLDLYLQHVADQLKIDLICSETEINQEKLTGKYLGADCSAQEKKRRILEQYDIAQYQHIYAYGNSDEDLDMLSLAHYPFLVGHDKNLPTIY